MTTDRISAPQPITFGKADDAARSVPDEKKTTPAQPRQVQITHYEGDSLNVDLAPAFRVNTRAEAELVGNLVGEAIREGYRVGWDAGLRASADPAVAMAALLPRQVIKIVERDAAGRITRVVETSQ